MAAHMVFLATQIVFWVLRTGLGLVDWVFGDPQPMCLPPKSNTFSWLPCQPRLVKAAGSALGELLGVGGTWIVQLLDLWKIRNGITVDYLKWSLTEKYLHFDLIENACCELWLILSNKINIFGDLK